MKRHAFTLLELIFVLVILGVLAKVAGEAFRPDTLRRDALYVALQIRRARYEGIGFDHRLFGGGETGRIGCVTLERSALESSPVAGRERYEIKSTLGGDLAGATLCFDRLGAPHFDDFNLTSLLREKKELTLEYRGAKKRLIVMPQSGYVIIN